MKSLKDKIYNSIYEFLNLDVSDVPIKYVEDFEFYKCIKSNYTLTLDNYNDIEQVKARYRFFCNNIPGLYKWKEKTVYIKENEKSDFSLLMIELLHAKSITQGGRTIKEWISEGIPHYLGKLICEKYNIPYKNSAHDIYFPLWNKIHEKYGLKLLVKLIYNNNITITIQLLKDILKYEKSDILEISFKKAIELID